VSNANVCSFYTDYTLYVLKPIISYANSYSLMNSGEEIDFNICNPLVSPNPKCEGAFACLKDEQGAYHPLSGTNFGSDIVGLVPEENRPGDTKKGGLTLYYEGSSDTCREGVNYKMNLNLYCDDSHERDMDNNDLSGIQFVSYNDVLCEYTVQAKSAHACYVFSLNALFRYITKYYIIFGIVMIIVGFFIGLFGKALVKPTICVVGTLAFVLVSALTIFTLAFDRDSSQVAEWVVFGICVVVGIFIGLLLAYLTRFGIAVLAAWGGVTVALMLYSSFLYQWDNDKRVLFWLFVVAVGVATGLIGFALFNHAIIISTSLIGSYLIIRGISLFAGGFPNEALIIEQIKNGQTPQFDNAFWGYLAGFIVLTLGCVVFQYKMFYRLSKALKNEHPYHRYR
jgi:hypothetical protein